MSPVRDVSWAKVMQGKGLGSSQGSSKPPANSMRVLLVQAVPCLTAGGLVLHLLLPVPLLPETKRSFGWNTWACTAQCVPERGQPCRSFTLFLRVTNQFCLIWPPLAPTVIHTYLWNRFFLLLPAQHFADISYWPWQNDNAGQQRRQTNLLANKDKFKSNYALPSCHNNKNSSVNSALQIIWNKHKVAKGW